MIPTRKQAREALGEEEFGRRCLAELDEPGDGPMDLAWMYGVTEEVLAHWYKDKGEAPPRTNPHAH